MIEAKTPEPKAPKPKVEGQSEESEDIRMQRNPLLYGLLLGRYKRFGADCISFFRNYIDMRQKNDTRSIDDIMSSRVEKLPFNLR